MNLGIPKSTPICELVLTGDFHLDGLLQNRLRHYLAGVSIRSGEPLVEASSLDPIATAVMAFLRIDNAIGNSTRQTGALKPRSLGRLTPGRPSNWNNVLAEMAAGMQSSMTLKTAV
jgi:1,6-anhydro-N-acetylmuramate kinase